MIKSIPASLSSRSKYSFFTKRLKSYNKKDVYSIDRKSIYKRRGSNSLMWKSMGTEDLDLDDYDFLSELHLSEINDDKLYL
jgi:hypothetical protein